MLRHMEFSYSGQRDRGGAAIDFTCESRVGAVERDLPQHRSMVRLMAVALLGLLLGWMVLAITIDRVFALSVPALALFWNPGSADANVRMADLLLQTSTVPGPSIAAHATRSLRRQLLNPGAARLLAMTLAMRGDARRSEALVRYAETMSRRDLPTQMLLIETAVARGDISTALVHYDRAMRASPQARVLMFPVLTAAAADPAIWQPLARRLAQRPQWWRPFVEQFIPRSTSPAALYVVARRTRIWQPPVDDPALLQAIEKRLVALGAYGAAADLFNRAHRLPAGAGAPLRNGGFEQPGGWDPFEWNMVDEPDLAAVRQPSPTAAGGSALFPVASNGRGGDVALQLVMLPPGRYAVTATMGGVTGDPLAFPHLAVRCAGAGGVLLDAAFPAAPDGGRVWQGRFAVPAGCRAQHVVISVGSSLNPSPSSPWIDNIAVRREGQ